MPYSVPDFKYTLRQFILMKTLQRGKDWDTALSAVTQTALYRPDLDLTEMRTFMDWEERRVY